jgi:hypothetical protein
MRVSAEQGGIKFLESPLGSRAFAATLLDERLTKIHLLINELMKLDDKQVAYILLRHCIALPKFRFASTELIMRAIALFDCILRDTTSELLGANSQKTDLTKPHYQSDMVVWA